MVAPTSSWLVLKPLAANRPPPAARLPPAARERNNKVQTASTMGVARVDSQTPSAGRRLVQLAHEPFHRKTRLGSRVWPPALRNQRAGRPMSAPERRAARKTISKHFEWAELIKTTGPPHARSASVEIYLSDSRSCRPVWRDGHLCVGSLARSLVWPSSGPDGPLSRPAGDQKQWQREPALLMSPSRS